MEMIIDKENNGVAYNDAEHVYWNKSDNERYVSVTTLIHSYTQPFDAEFWSAYKALQKLMSPDLWKIESASLRNSQKFSKEMLTMYEINEDDFNKEQQAILDEWEKNKNEACERGTKIHAQFENAVYGMGNNVSLEKFGVGGKFVYKQNHNELDLEYGAWPEYLISRQSEDGILRIAGQIDLLVKSGNDITIIDYKTNKEIKQKSGFDSKTKSSVKMQFPLNTLPDCNYYHYQMQLSTYAWMIQKINPEFKIKDLILVHIDHNGKQTLYHLEYLKKEVEAMLRDYKKKLYLEKQRSKRLRIEY